MRFRPCIDIHNGKVKQIVGGSLLDQGDQAKENFVAEQDAAWYAALYRESGAAGGHVILLNAPGSPFYEETRRQAFLALAAFPGGLMLGGGVRPENAKDYLDGGASHVIVTSYVFRDGTVCRENLEKMVRAVGADRLVLDLSCRKRDGRYYIVTDRWQKFTDVELTADTMRELGGSCAEFLVHAVDVEGKASGVDASLIRILAEYGEKPVTYAGGVASAADLDTIRTFGKNRLDVTIGSALDIFGGTIPFRDVLFL